MFALRSIFSFLDFAISRLSILTIKFLLSSQGEGKETEVTWEDQQNINTFGRLNNKLHDLEDDIKLKKVNYFPCFLVSLFSVVE